MKILHVVLFKKFSCPNEELSFCKDVYDDALILALSGTSRKSELLLQPLHYTRVSTNTVEITTVLQKNCMQKVDKYGNFRYRKITLVDL